MNFFIRIAVSVLLFLPLAFAYASSVPSDVGFSWVYPTGTIASGGLNIIGVLSLIQSILLKVILPIVVIWASLYIAYELFTAEWDETKMKKAWKSVTFAAVGLICIAVSYAFVEVLSTLSI